MRRLPALGMILLAATASAATPEIAWVKSISDLRKTEAIHLKDWDVQLGVGDSGKDGGTWAVVYCEATWTGKGDKPVMPVSKNSESMLGPVVVNVAWDQDVLRDQLQAAESNLGEKTDAKNLYCFTVPLGKKGTCHISIRDVEAKELARRDVVVKEEPKFYWHIFAMPAYWMPQTYAVYPQFDGRRQVFSAAMMDVKTTLGKGREAVDGLPGEIPLEENWRVMLGGKAAAGKPAYMLKISLDGDAYLIESQGPVIQEPGYYLARWWVNGKAVEAPVAEEKARSAGMQIQNRKDERVAFGLPETLGELKVGDTVALQVMYSAGGVRNLPGTMTAMAVMIVDPAVTMIPLVSEKLEFKITAALLKQAGDRKEPKEAPAKRSE